MIYSNKLAPKINLNEIINDVFPLTKTDYQILKFIAVNPCPPNLKEITSFIQKSDVNVGKSRWSISRRLQGSPKIPGLIPHGFVYLHHEEKSYHDMFRHYLTLKGIFTSLRDIDFGSVHSFIWYFDYLEKIFQDKRLLQFAKDFIYSQIIFFLYLHKIKGLQLTRLASTMSYCDLFFNSGLNTLFDDLPLEHLSKSELSEFRNISLNFFVLRETFETLKKSNIFPKMNIFDQYIPLETNALFFQPKMVSYSSHVLIQNWCYFVPYLQIMYYKTKDWNQKEVDWSLGIKENVTVKFQENIDSKISHYSEKILRSYGLT